MAGITAKAAFFFVIRKKGSCVAVMPAIIF
jgi:hypothetical protein